MPGELRFVVEGEARAAVLCRLLGLLAARDLQAPALTVSVYGESMTVRMTTTDLEARAAQIVERKMTELVGVSSVCLGPGAAADLSVHDPV